MSFNKTTTSTSDDQTYKLSLKLIKWYGGHPNKLNKFQPNNVLLKENS